MKRSKQRHSAAIINVLRALILISSTYILFRCFLNIGAASRVVSQVYGELLRDGTSVAHAEYLDAARQFLNKSLDPFLYSSLILVLLGCLPWVRVGGAGGKSLGKYSPGPQKSRLEPDGGDSVQDEDNGE